MYLLVTYDVNTEESAGRKRLRKVAQICKNFGQRVQLSVFECSVDEKDFLVLRSQLLAQIDESKDSLRIYHLGEKAKKSVEHFGIGAPRDFEKEALIV